MDFDFFQRQIERLKETFGQQYYKDERVKLLWNDVRALSNQWLASVVSDFIYSSRQAPLGDEFRDKIGRERERELSNERAKDTFEEAPPNNNACTYCHDVGTLMHEGYAYKCFCRSGRKRTEKYPVFKGT
jgi:hypothetical protein